MILDLINILYFILALIKAKILSERILSLGKLENPFKFVISFLLPEIYLISDNYANGWRLLIRLWSNLIETKNYSF